MRNQYTCDIDATLGVIPHPIADDDHETFVYEFLGDLSYYDLQDLVNEDGEVEDHGYIAKDLLTDVLLNYTSTLLEAEKRLEVFNLLKKIFDPNDTVFCGGAFTYGYFENSSWGGPLLTYTRYAGQRMTKLLLKFRTEDRDVLPQENRRLQILCITYETLRPNPDVRRT